MNSFHTVCGSCWNDPKQLMHILSEDEEDSNRMALILRVQDPDERFLLRKAVVLLAFLFMMLV